MTAKILPFNRELEPQREDLPYLDNVVKIIRDPLGKFPGMPDDDFFNLTALPGTWALEAMRDKVPVLPYMLGQYGFPVAPMTGGEVKEHGAYLYPEDPELYPLVTLKAPSTTVHIYQYGMVAVIEKGSTTVVRLD
jgi:hypothetical protein